MEEIKMKYEMFYYLKGQREILTDLQFYGTDDHEMFKQAIGIANVNGYKIVKIIKK